MKNTQSQLIRDARRFAAVLESGDATPLLSLKPKARQDAMRALSNLARYRGVYPEWKGIIERYQLKWSTGNDEFNEQWITDLVNDTNQLPQMLSWLKEATAKLPALYANALIANCLNGLRVSESYESLRLLQTDRANYVVQKSGVDVLMHFRYPGTFTRKTKKALISIATPEVMEFLQSTTPVSANALRLATERYGLPVHSKWARRIHGSELSKAGLSDTEVDILAGRVPQSVFAKHYKRIGIDWSKFAGAIEQLWHEVSPLIKH